MSSFKLLQPQPCDTQHRSLRAGGLADLATFPPQRDRDGDRGLTLQRLPSPSARDGLLEQTRSCCKENLKTSHSAALGGLDTR